MTEQPRLRRDPAQRRGAPPLLESRPLRLETVQFKLEQIASQPLSRSEQLQRFCEAAVALCTADWACCLAVTDPRTDPRTDPCTDPAEMPPDVTCGPGSTSTPNHTARTQLVAGHPAGHEFTGPPDGLRLSVASRVAATGELHLHRDGKRSLVGVPILTATGPNVLLAGLTLAPGSPVEPFGLMLQLVATAIQSASRLQLAESSRDEAQATAALAELVHGIQLSEDEAAAGIFLVNQLRAHLDCDAVAWGVVAAGGGVTLRAASGLSGGPAGEAASVWETAIGEAALQSGPVEWPEPAEDQRGPNLALRQLARQQSWRAALSVPLQGPDGAVVGGLVCGASRSADDWPRHLRFLTAAGPFLATALDTLRQARGGPWRRAYRRVLSGRRGSLLRVAAAAACLLAAGLLPVPHRVGCDCRVEPAAHRFAVAPYDGILQRAEAKSGDRVAADQLLAEMDDREQRLALAGLLADRARAAKQRDTSRSEHDVSATQLAELALRRLDLQIQLLRHRQQHLAVRSPVDGIVLRGRWDDAQGAPVKTGQVLYEIAPLDRMRIDLHVPDDEVRFLRPGLPVTIVLESDVALQLEGTVAHLRPAAEIHNDRNVFVAEVLVANPQGRIRPGMRGRAKIRAGRAPLGWIALHKPWERLVALLR